MKGLLEKFDNLGYDLLALDNLVYLSLDTGHTTNCPGVCDGGCQEGCYTCYPGCPNGGK